MRIMRKLLTVCRAASVTEVSASIFGRCVSAIVSLTRLLKYSLTVDWTWLYSTGITLIISSIAEITMNRMNW